MDLDGLSDARGVDVLHMHTAIPYGFGRHRFRVPVVHTLHGHGPYCPSGSKFLQRQGRPCPRVYAPVGCALGHLVDHCGSVRPRGVVAQIAQFHEARQAIAQRPTILVSDFCRRELLRSGQTGDNLHVVLSPAWGGLAPPAAGAGRIAIQDAPRFLFLGRVVPAKGVAWLLRALARTRVPMHLDIAGDGYEGTRMKELSKSLRLDDRVTFHGWVSRQRSAELLVQARALVLPSLWHEPAGLVSVEAAAHARPVVAARVGGIPEYVINEETGMLVEPDDVLGLANALDILARDGGRAQELGRRAYERAAEIHAVPRYVAEVQRIYEDARSAIV